MLQDPKMIIEAADVGAVDGGALESRDPTSAPLDLDKMPDGVVSGSTLIDLSAVRDVTVRSSVSLAMLFASRVATASVKDGDDEDDWLAKYTEMLAKVGFRISGTAVTDTRFKKTGIAVHKALIPFLTIAFGGAAVGPVILAGLNNLQEMNKDDPWIALFDRQTRRFDISEMHFAAVSANETDTTIRYVVARLNVETGTTKVLFFKLEKANAKFESATTTMMADNSLLATIEPQLRAKLQHLISSTIAEADIG